MTKQMISNTDLLILDTDGRSPSGSSSPLLPLHRVPSKIDLEDDNKSFGSYLERSQSSAPSSAPSSSPSTRKREMFCWAIIALQACALLGMLQWTTLHPFMNIQKQRRMDPYIAQNDRTSNGKNDHNPLSINNRPVEYHEERFTKSTQGQPFFDPPTFNPKEAGLVSRVWHSNKSPAVNDGLQSGSCWCSNDEFCMCTPSLAVDVILTSGPDHVYLVERGDTHKLALMGGFNEVGETVEEAARRELAEEMNIELPLQGLQLFGVYSDPKRDDRKHSVSVVYVVDVPLHMTPVAGDDAVKVHRIGLDEIDDLNTHADHKTVLRDFRNARQRANALEQQRTNTNNKGQGDLPPIPRSGDEEPFKRSICPML